MSKIRWEIRSPLKKPLLFGLFSVLVICPLIACCQHQSRATEPEASNVVQKFVQWDFEGYRLDSEGHQAIWKLTIDDGAPPESPVFVVKGYTIAVPQKSPDGSLRISVNYDVVGLVDEGTDGLYFKTQTSVRKEVFPVNCAGEECRIDLDRKVFHVSPYVGTEAVLTWLKQLQSIQDTPQEKQTYQRLYEQVKDGK